MKQSPLLSHSRERGKKGLRQKGGETRCKVGEVAHIADTPLAHVLFIDSNKFEAYSSSRASSSSPITWLSFSYPSFQGYTFPFRDAWTIWTSRDPFFLRQFFYFTRFNERFGRFFSVFSRFIIRLFQVKLLVELFITLL